MDPAEPRPEEAPRHRVTRGLIWANIGVFFLAASMNASGVVWVNEAYGAVPARLSADLVGESYKLLSSQFIHDGPAALLWNMAFLYFFGRRLEVHLGAINFVLLYLMSGVVGALANYLVDPNVAVPLVGASGSISGVMGARLAWLPSEERSFSRTLLLGAIVFWLVTNVLAGLASLGDPTGTTAFFAHLGGFAAGVVLSRLFPPHEEAEHSLPQTSNEPYVANKPIFKKEDDGPFWRS